MKTFNHHTTTYFAAALYLIAATLFSYGCSRDQETGVHAEPATVALQMRLSVDPADIDDYVTTLRIIGFGRDDGSLACNTLHTVLTPAADGTLVFTEKVRRTGINFYVIANETAAMTAALDYIYTESQFLASDAVMKIEYVPDWKPAPDSPFLMSECISVELPSSGGAVLESSVSLQRMPARLSFSLKNEYVETQIQNGKTYNSMVKIDDVHLETVPRYQAAVFGGTKYNYGYLNENVPLKLSSGGSYPAGTWENTYEDRYIPEHFIPDNDPENATLVCFKAQRYFVNAADTTDVLGVVTSKQYRVPIQSPMEAGEGMDYNVRRNNHYKMQCRITKWDEGPVVTSEVVPWELNIVEVDFDTPQYEIMPVDMVVQDGCPAVVGIGGSITYSIRLIGPKGARWHATITNGLDFELASGMRFAQSGYVTPDMAWLVKVVSKREWMEGTPRVTDLIFMINDKEVYRVKDITVVESL